jgi:hypothetical protein
MYKVLKEYIDEDKMEEFIGKILNVRGTNSSFKIVFSEVADYIKMKSDTKK